MSTVRILGSIHGMVLRRLLAVWLLVALIATGIGYWVEVNRFEEGLIAVAMEDINTLTRSSPGANDANQLTVETRDFMSKNYLWIRAFDRDAKQIHEIHNPAQPELIRSLQEKTVLMPKDSTRHFEKITLNGTTIVRILVHLPASEFGPVTTFDGAFVLDPQHLRQQRDKLWRMIIGIVLASLATALVLYPVIIALNRDVIRASRDILRGNLETAAVLGAAISKRDSDTGEHNYRVALYAIYLAEAIGLKREQIRNLILGAFLHDVGKIGIPDAILLKPGRLDEEEIAVMRQHVSLGLDIVANSHWLAPARDVIGHHHEKFDGTGYAQSLAGEEIPLNARIFAVVDVFDALVSQRPYKPPLLLTAALSILRDGCGKHFDPVLVNAFTTIAEQAYQAVNGKSEHALSEMLGQRLPSYFFLSR